MIGRLCKIRWSGELRLWALIAVGMLTVTDANAENEWHRSPGSALQSAQTSGKPIVVFVSTPWCHYCQQMIGETWQSPNVSALLSDRFTKLVLDGDRDQSIVETLQVTGYPATLLFTPEGNLISRRSGYMSPEETIEWLDQSSR